MLAAAKLRWNSSDFYRNGRQGQKQDGVDIWVMTTTSVTSVFNVRTRWTVSRSLL